MATVKMLTHLCLQGIHIVGLILVLINVYIVNNGEHVPLCYKSHR